MTLRNLLRPATLGLCLALGGLAARGGAPELQLEPLESGFSNLVSIEHAGDDRLFLTEQDGEILIWDGDSVLPTPFLDLSSVVTGGLEGGLKSIAFHPDFASNGFFFVHYSALDQSSVIARYEVTADPDVADPLSGVPLLTIPQFTGQHRGGSIAFGPDDYLYIALGDGGGQHDPECRAQDPETLHGKILRIDVDQNVDVPPYHGVPADNPFFGAGPPLDEIWALGFRNPWRISFDRVSGDLYIADVGQDEREEVNRQPASSTGGENYGWVVMEGNFCHDPDPIDPDCPAATASCFDVSYTAPAFDYDHSGGNCSITGGFVYRGSSIPTLAGSYVYGDWCTGNLWAALDSGGWTSTLLPVSLGSILSFGEDVDGELYLSNGTNLYRLSGTEIFADGFESGSTGAWSMTIP